MIFYNRVLDEHEERHKMNEAIDNALLFQRCFYLFQIFDHHGSSSG